MQPTKSILKNSSTASMLQEVSSDMQSEIKSRRVSIE